MMRVGHAKIWQNSIPGQLSSRYKGPEVRCAWSAGGSKRRYKMRKSTYKMRSERQVGSRSRRPSKVGARVYLGLLPSAKGGH